MNSQFVSFLNNYNIAVVPDVTMSDNNFQRYLNLLSSVTMFRFLRIGEYWIFVSSTNNDSFLLFFKKIASIYPTVRLILRGVDTISTLEDVTAQLNRLPFVTNSDHDTFDLNGFQRSDNPARHKAQHELYTSKWKEFVNN